MQQKIVFIFFFILLTPSLPSNVSFSSELKSQYTTVIYENEKLLKKFNRNVYLGSLSYLTREKESIAVSDEVRHKIDTITERAKIIIETFPKKLRFTIVFLSSATDVQRIYKEKYNIKTNYIAFYSPEDKTIFISVNNVDTGVLAHEVAHAVIDKYFVVSPPARVHEILAQYVEYQITIK